MIACAACKSYHESIALVRECCANHYAQKVFDAQQQELFPAPKPEAKYVPPGRYALETKNGLRFYKVERPTEGQWKGYTFVSIEHSDDLNTKVKDSQRKGKILRAIGEDPQEAMLRYGRELKQCGHCGRNLRNKTSRERGIGPVCFSRVDW